MTDAGYESRKLARELKRRHGWRLHITKRRQRAFKVVGLTWIVERTFEHLKDKPGTKEVLVIEVHPGAAVGVPRTKGFVDEIKKHDDYKIVASLNGNDTVQGGYQATQNTLSANPNLAGIYATNG